MLHLIEILAQVDRWENEAGTIYVARPWAADADAIILNPAPDATDPIHLGAKTYDYFLETFIALEFLDGFSRSQDGLFASDEQKCDRLIQYAIDDA